MNSKIMFLWGSIVVLICAFLIVLSNSQKDKVLLRLERDVKTATKEYVANENLEPKFNESTVVYIEQLLEKKYLKDEELLNEYCINRITFTKGLVIDKYIIIKECEKELKNNE
ncbi:MAG: hypothetical protein GX758_00855 [Tenericutes bacterium]|nr:hypothetical protein [Mycoplasmatota bacterium]